MRNLTFIYITALAIIALVIIASQYLVQQSISTSIYDSRTINISGRQAMLSQKLSKAALAMQTASAQGVFNQRKQELNEATELFETSHNALQYGNEEMQLNNVNNSEKTLLLFLEMEPHYLYMRSGVDDLLNLSYDHPAKDSIIAVGVNKILASENNFLDIMNQITFDYDDESSARISELSQTEYVLLAIALALLLAEAIFIFRPVIKRITVYTGKLIDQEKALKHSLELQKEEKAKVDFLNKQAESVFANVNQGLFLMDNEYKISELYSKELESILDEQNMAKQSFLQIMRSKLVKRDQDALQMFVKQLFNSAIEDEILEQLNPLEEIEIYTNNNSPDIRSKHLRVSFSRIRDLDYIYSVLVTLSDETEAVQLQRKISETEAKNKRESEQLLSILRVDPLTLKDFLETTQISLRSISEKYENAKTSDLRDLVSFTFSTIHNIKGNAQIIELDLLVDKLHGIENIIIQLREKANLIANDFLKILYEINDMGSIVTNMQRMLDRIVEVNRKIAQEENKPLSNSNFIAQLRKGLKNLSQEIGKPVDLSFNENGILIPERFRLSVKDIFIQLFRNSLTHGIESSEERIARGKRETAAIDITIDKALDGEFIFTYKDDGRGLNKEKILIKAVNGGILSEEEAAEMEDNEVYNLIFEDSFSTADSVTQFAGRGQGMQIVKSMIEKYDGKYYLSEDCNEGFKIEIALPTTSQLISTLA